MPAIIVALTALVVYASTLAHHALPGESARLAVERLGLDGAGSALHPLWSLFAGWFASVPLFAGVVRMNVFSLLCGVAAAGLLARLVSRFVRVVADSDETRPFAAGAARAAAATAGVAFVFAMAPWDASTHLDYRIFDLLWGLLCFELVGAAGRFPRAGWLFALLSGVAFAWGCVESAPVAATAPFVLWALVATCRRREKSAGGHLFLFAASAGVGAVWAVSFAAGAAGSSFADAFKAVVSFHKGEAMSWFSHAEWKPLVATLVQSALPCGSFVACALIARRGLNAERRWSQYWFHLAMTLCAACLLATPLAPSAVWLATASAPVASCALVAAVAGYLAAYWWILAKTPEEEDLWTPAMRAGRKLAPVAFCALAAVTALAALVNFFVHDSSRGDFADRLSREALKRLGDRAWYVTDGTLDDNLRLAAAAEGRDLTLVCLHRDLDDAYLKKLAARAKALEKDVPGVDLEGAALLGVLPFLQDWFANDPKAAEKAVVAGMPDLWGLASAQPVPCALFFRGNAGTNGLDGVALKKDFEAFWNEFRRPLKTAKRGAGSLSMADCDDPVERQKLNFRRHVGLVANDLGVLLQDLGCDEEAFALYELVLKEIDPDNVCALYNEFEMVRADVPAARKRAKDVEKALKALVDDPRRRYHLWALSRWYGYIRNPEIFVRMGFAWAATGQFGSALAQVRRAIDILPENHQAAMLNMMAAIYAGEGKNAESRETYAAAAAAGGETARVAYLGLARMALQEGKLEDAKLYLGKVPEKGSELERGLLALATGDPAAASAAFTRATDVQPDSTQAWSMRAAALMARADQTKDAAEKKKALEEVEKVVLPRLATLAGDPREYYLNLTAGLFHLRKGRAFRKDARDALGRALAARPEVAANGDMVLDLDVKLNDEEAGLRHARIVLRRDRANKLANWVMGSVLLNRGDFLAAEKHLRLSCAGEKSTPAAMNDFAEALRRLEKYAEAETWARKAVEAQPELYVSWETLGGVLLDRKKNLDEAETCVLKAVELARKSGNADPRMQLSLARVQLARGDRRRAAATLRAVSREADKFGNWDRNRYESLLREARASSARD